MQRTSAMKLALAEIIVLAAGALAAASPAMAREPLACLAPTHTADAGRPLAEVSSLEFYVDEGDPLRSYGEGLALVRSVAEGDGRVRNDYRFGPGEAVRGTIVFAGAIPVSFAVGPLKRTYISLQKNDAETVSMADAIPGIVCYTVTVETTTF